MPELSWRSLAITDDGAQASSNGSAAAQRPPLAPSAASKPVHKVILMNVQAELMSFNRRPAGRYHLECSSCEAQIAHACARVVHGHWRRSFGSVMEGVRVVWQGVSRFLDRTGNEDRAAIKLHAKAAEFEYEDEYDDSYDDLGGGGADGIADVEGVYPVFHGLQSNNCYIAGQRTYWALQKVKVLMCFNATNVYLQCKYMQMHSGKTFMLLTYAHG